jgi:hypothetical protein
VSVIISLIEWFSKEYPFSYRFVSRKSVVPWDRFLLFISKRLIPFLFAFGHFIFEQFLFVTWPIMDVVALGLIPLSLLRWRSTKTILFMMLSSSKARGTMRYPFKIIIRS